MAARDRDDEFRVEYPDLYRHAHNAAFRVAGERATAQEIAQETLTRAYVAWNKLDERRIGWVVTTATRLAIDRWRRDNRRRRLHVPLAVERAVEPDRVDIVRILAALPRRQREVAVLRYLEDWPEAEVARALGCSVGAVKQHASRALAALRAEVTSYSLATEDR